MYRWLYPASDSAGDTGMSTANASTSVTRTGFTAARNFSRTANAVRLPNSSLRFQLRTDTVLLNGFFVQIETQARQLGQVDVAVFHAEDVGRPDELTRRRPLLLRQNRATDDFLPLAITHGTARLDIAGQRQRSRTVLDARHTEGLSKHGDLARQPDAPANTRVR